MPSPTTRTVNSPPLTGGRRRRRRCVGQARRPEARAPDRRRDRSDRAAVAVFPSSHEIRIGRLAHVRLYRRAPGVHSGLGSPSAAARTSQISGGIPVAGQRSGRWCAAAHATASGRAPAARSRCAQLVVVHIPPECARPPLGPGRGRDGPPPTVAHARPTGPRLVSALPTSCRSAAASHVGSASGPSADRGAAAVATDSARSAARAAPSTRAPAASSVRARTRGRRRRAGAAATSPRSAGRGGRPGHRKTNR